MPGMTIRGSRAEDAIRGELHTHLRTRGPHCAGPGSVLRAFLRTSPSEIAGYRPVVQVHRHEPSSGNAAAFDLRGLDVLLDRPGERTASQDRANSPATESDDRDVGRVARQLGTNGARLRSRVRRAD